VFVWIKGLHKNQTGFLEDILMKPGPRGNKGEINKPNTNEPGFINGMISSIFRKLFRSEEGKSSALLWLSLESDLKKAIEREELNLNYQPIIETQSGKIYGMEALLRWHHPHFGIIPPLDVFSVAEATDLATPIGEWVLEMACSQTVKWQKSTPFPLKIFINLSMTHVRAANFIETLYYVLNSTKIEPSSVILEIPQTASLEQEDASMLKTISRSGVGLSIDDFGTSNSSWQLLRVSRTS
jgi:EAL domain-containing protein (putative c-di-GMP-specific phosphodiesterase class I)